MKMILTLSVALAFAGLSFGHCGACEGGKKECATKAECSKGECSKTVAAKGECSKGECSKTVAAKGECSKGECSKGECSKTVAAKGECSKGECSKTVAAKGECAKSECAKTASMKGECAKSKCSKGECYPEAKKLKVTLAANEGTDLKTALTSTLAKFERSKMKELCASSGCYAIKYDGSKNTEAEVMQALTASGITISEQEVSFKVTGLTCGGCANTLTKAIAKTEGVVGIDKICHASGHAVLTIDPAKTDANKIKAAINATKFKVADAVAQVETTAPQS